MFPGKPLCVFKLAVIQCALANEDGDNANLVEKLIRAASDAGADLVLPPELFDGPYFPQSNQLIIMFLTGAIAYWPCPVAYGII